MDTPMLEPLSTGFTTQGRGISPQRASTCSGV